MVESLDVVEPKELEPPQVIETKPITLEILKLIKDLQQQHGLRHGDYQRYRSYCSRRLRRLRKVLKVPQGDRRHFKKRDISEAHLNLPNADERYLHIPLVLAERAWAYAMQLRQEANSEMRKKFHLISKLRKACGHAHQLETLCNATDRCDARTKLEAGAYSAWMQGVLQFELQLWQAAAENLKKAQVVYEKLCGSVAGEHEQAVYKQRIEELTPSLRYCAYNVGEEGAELSVAELRGLEHLDALALQAKQQRGGTGGESMELQWQGLKVVVRPEKCRLFLLELKGLDEALQAADGSQARITLLEEMLVDCRDAVAAARDEVRSGQPDSQPLLTYLLHVRLIRTIQRNLCLVEQARRPQDAVRLHDIILQQVAELRDLSGLQENQEYQRQLSNETSLYRALRTYHLARANAGARRWREALILYRSSLQLADSLISTELKARAEQLQKDIRAEVHIAQAHCVLQDETDEPTAQRQGPKPKTPLIERLDEYREDQPRSARILSMPAMQPLPNKPLFFDLASNFVHFPDISDKIDTPAASAKPNQSQGMSGFVKGLFGWANK